MYMGSKIERENMVSRVVYNKKIKKNRDRNWKSDNLRTLMT